MFPKHQLRRIKMKRLVSIFLLVLLLSYSCSGLQIISGDMRPALDKLAHLCLGSTVQAFGEKQGLTKDGSAMLVITTAIAVEIIENQMNPKSKIDLSDIAWTCLGGISWQIVDGVFLSFRGGH